MRSWVVLESKQACEPFLEPDVHEQPQRGFNVCNPDEHTSG